MKLYRAGSEYNPDDPAGVIGGCMRNDPKAQHALIKMYYGYVKSIALRYSSDDVEAEEILNDSFLKMFNNLDKYDKHQAFKGWLRTIVVNTAIDYYRKNKKKPVFTDYLEVDKQQVADVNNDIINNISAEEILSLVRELTPAYRTVFSMYVIDGFSHKEIAEKLGIMEGTSKSNLQDARKKLQQMIIKLYPKLYAAYELKNLPRHEA